MDGDVMYIPRFVRDAMAVEKMKLSRSDQARIKAGGLVYAAAVDEFGVPTPETAASWAHGQIREWMDAWVNEYVKRETK